MMHVQHKLARPQKAMQRKGDVIMKTHGIDRSSVFAVGYACAGQRGNGSERVSIRNTILR